MSGSKDNPHDKRHKELFSNKKSFLSLLKDCIKEPWVNELDEESITKTDKSFILQDFSEKEADIVYEAKINGSTVVFYILLELQSTVDYRMPYRLLLYIVEILRFYYNHADVNKRDNKDFKFPAVFPIVFFSGNDTWTVPTNLRDMFSNAEMFGDYLVNFEYMLVNAKGYDNETLKNFRSKLLGIVLMLEKSKNDIEFYTGIRNSLNEIGQFDAEERRILNLCIKILDMAYGYNKSEAIKELLDENKYQEADKMLCDMIENAKLEREQLIEQGVLKVAKAMIADKCPIDDIIKYTNLSKDQLEKIGA